MLSRPETLTPGHDLSAFDCGKPALNAWLRQHALRNQMRGFTAVVVVHEANRVVGYYGLAPTAVIPDALPRAIRTGQAPNPVPCLLLGQLATDLSWAGHGIGGGLLMDAMRRSVAAAALIGGRALLVRAIDAEAVDFWQRRDFKPAPGDPMLLMRPLADIANALAASAS